MTGPGWNQGQRPESSRDRLVNNPQEEAAILTSFHATVQKNLQAQNEKRYREKRKKLLRIVSMAAGVAIVLVISALFILGPGWTADFSYKKGMACYEKKDYETAVPYFETYLSIKKKDPKIAFNLADCYARQQNFDKAVERYQSVLADDPSMRKDVAPRLGYCVIRQGEDIAGSGKRDDAKKHLKEAVKQYPEYEGFRTNKVALELGNEAVKKSDVKLVFYYADLANIINFKDVKSQMLTMEATFLSRDYDTTLVLLQKILRTNPALKTTLAPFRRNLSQAFIQGAIIDSSQQVKASQLLNKALQADPKNPEVFYRRGNMYLNMDKLKEARVEFKIAQKLRPDKNLYKKIEVGLQQVAAQQKRKTELAVARAEEERVRRQLAAQQRSANPTPSYTHIGATPKAVHAPPPNLQRFTVLGGTASCLVVEDPGGNGLLLSGSTSLPGGTSYGGEHRSNRVILYKENSSTGFSYAATPLTRASVTSVTADDSGGSTSYEVTLSAGKTVTIRHSTLGRRVDQGDSLYVSFSGNSVVLYMPDANYTALRCSISE